MPARVVIVHDDPAFLDPAVAALRLAGYDVAAFSDSMAAISALEAIEKTELLITRVHFPAKTPNGVALARMARHKRREIKVLFAAHPNSEKYVGDLGEFLPTPVEVSQLVRTVSRMIEPGDPLQAGSIADHPVPAVPSSS
jgi:DNA-binding NtrC family response regulator